MQDVAPPAPRGVVVDEGLSGHDPHIAAMDRQTAAMMALVGEIREARGDFKPAADAIHGLFEAQAKFCTFVVGNRLKIVAGVLAVLVGTGAISPTAASMLSAALKAAGLQ